MADLQGQGLAHRERETVAPVPTFVVPAHGSLAGSPCGSCRPGRGEGGRTVLSRDSGITCTCDSGITCTYTGFISLCSIYMYMYIIYNLVLICSVSN